MRSFATAILHVLVRPRLQEGKTHLVPVTEWTGPRGTGGGGGREGTGFSLLVERALQWTLFVCSRILKVDGILRAQLLIHRCLMTSLPQLSLDRDLYRSVPGFFQERLQTFSVLESEYSSRPLRRTSTCVLSLACAASHRSLINSFELYAFSCFSSFYFSDERKVSMSGLREGLSLSPLNYAETQ